MEILRGLCLLIFPLECQEYLFIKLRFMPIAHVLIKPESIFVCVFVEDKLCAYWIQEGIHIKPVNGVG